MHWWIDEVSTKEINLWEIPELNISAFYLHVVLFQNDERDTGKEKKFDTVLQMRLVRLDSEIQTKYYMKLTWN